MRGISLVFICCADLLVTCAYARVHPGHASNHWISEPSNDRRKNLVVGDLDLSTSFEGLSATGRWVLRMRDAKAGNPSVFRNFSVTLTAPATP